MTKHLEQQMYRDFAAILAHKRFLQPAGLSKKSLPAFLRAQGWPARFAAIADIRGRFSCATALELAQDTLGKFSPPPAGGWLNYCYRFALQLSFPPQVKEDAPQGQVAGALFLLALLQTLFRAEQRALPFDWRYDLCFITEEEEEACEGAPEYRRLRTVWQRNFIYEMMRLGKELTPHLTLSHIAGVHHLALTTARGLLKGGAPLDLSLISGAALLHDIGKFGCKNGENVPHLHYYYTDRFCRAHGLPNIGHIAANHSMWDLELTLLPAESLLLIYADFRVREQRQGAEPTMTRLSLDKAYGAIYNKMEQVDDAKRRRYEFVYAKLHNFEDYLRALGVDVELSGQKTAPLPSKDCVLMSPAEAIEAWKFASIGHNIALMHRLDSERLFGNILEAARSEKKWKNVRAYINIFEEYFAYLNSGQKVQLLGFLYELLMHREGDIRRRAANLVGNIVTHFHEGFRKQLPAGNLPGPDEVTALSLWEKYLDMIIQPDHKLTTQHKSWIGYTLKIVVDSVLNHCAPEDRRLYLSVMMRYFASPGDFGDFTSFVLLDAMNYLPLELCTEQELAQLADFAIQAAAHEPIELTAAALRVLRRIAELLSGPDVATRARIGDFARRYAGNHITLIFLKGRLLRALGLDDSGQQALLEQGDIVADIFLDNLKTATPWIIKAINIKILLDQIERGQCSQLLHIAAHFSNLIKVSERVVVRHDAGAALLRIAPLLSTDQRNEVAVELTKGLEVGEYEFSKYIPDYLGAFALWLPPAELDELITSLGQLSSGTNERIISVALSTIGVLLRHYPAYRQRFPEEQATYRERQERLLGMLLTGLASHQPTVRQEALLVIGQGLFGSTELPAAEKCHIFALLIKKMLYLIGEQPEDELSFFYTASALNHIYRFISEQMLMGSLDFESRDKVAFFPGTFDPFTLSHKAIVREIRDMGFEVMLAIDEFSWSKKTQPRLIRRQIAGISVADQFHVHIFPDSIPVNLANPADLRRLKEAFPGQRVYIVAGSDVVEGASAYLAEPRPGSIHHWDHILFKRVSAMGGAESGGKAVAPRLTGQVIELSLPPHLEDISSSRIREDIDQNRDISHLIDAAAQEFIYQNSLYLREPQYKQMIYAKEAFFEQVERPGRDVLTHLLQVAAPELETQAQLLETITQRGDSLLILRDGANSNQPLAFASLRRLSSCELYAELGDLQLSEAVRRQAGGCILLITSLFAAPGPAAAEAEQLLLTEALAVGLDTECANALYHPLSGAEASPRLTALLARQGFIRLGQTGTAHPLYMVNMSNPVVLIQNMETVLKEPFATTPRVQATIAAAHTRLQTALCGLYPGNLVLSLSGALIHQRLIEKITALNGVPGIPVSPRQLGPLMCVPFGKLLRGKVVPNTVTKTLHTDKVFEPDLQSSSIEAYPYYPPLDNQIRTIKSFMRPVILVDDLIHGGDRMLALDPLFKEEGLDVRMVLVGLLSGYGRDLMKVKGRPVDSVYFVPNLRQWCVESTLYPFIGGDTLRRPQGRAASGLLPSVNMILPYAAPIMAGQAAASASFELSLACLANAREIFLTLETEYRGLFARNLTLNRLSEAVILPLCPDKGSCMGYDPNLSVSIYLENDIEMLLRMQKAVL